MYSFITSFRRLLKLILSNFLVLFPNAVTDSILDSMSFCCNNSVSVFLFLLGDNDFDDVLISS